MDIRIEKNMDVKNDKEEVIFYEFNDINKQYK